MEHFDVAVCGLGAVGSAATYHLAGRGVRVLGLDRHAPPHSRGSTHGESRITRQAIGEGLAYVPLAQRAHQLWRDLEEEAGADLLTVNGLLVIAAPGTQTRHNGKTRFLETTIEAAESFGIDHAVLSAADIRRGFPQFALDGDEAGYFEPGAGFVRPEAAVSAHLQLAARRGADLRVDEALTAYTQQGDGVVITTTRGRYSADVLVLAAGPWLGRLLGAPYARSFAVTRQVLQWFAVDDDAAAYRPERLPVFIWDSGPLSFYGTPSVGGSDAAVKVGVENPVASGSIADASREVGREEIDRVYETVIRHRMPGLSPRCVKAVTCMYTTTPDGDFVVDRHPEHPSVLIVSACSGHGFKHSPAIGEAVAARIVGERPCVDLGAFDGSRLWGGGARPPRPGAPQPAAERPGDG